MTCELFTQTLNQAAHDVRRRLRQVEYRTQSPDHPILWAADESYYLKFYIFQVCDENRKNFGKGPEKKRLSRRRTAVCAEKISRPRCGCIGACLGRVVLIKRCFSFLRSALQHHTCKDDRCPGTPGGERILPQDERSECCNFIAAIPKTFYFCFRCGEYTARNFSCPHVPRVSEF